MSGNKRGARYLPFTCCTCVFLPLHGMQRRVETLLSEAQLLDTSFASSRVSSRFLRASSLFQSRRVSLQPPIRQYHILESDLPSTCSLAKFPPNRNLFLVGARRTAAYRLVRLQRNTFLDRLRIETPGLVNQRGIRAADIYFEQLVLIGATDSFDLSVYRWQRVTSEIDCIHVFCTSHEADSFLLHV